jgi:hypothetical protein
MSREPLSRLRSAPRLATARLWKTAAGLLLVGDLSGGYAAWDRAPAGPNDLKLTSDAPVAPWPSGSPPVIPNSSSAQEASSPSVAGSRAWWVKRRNGLEAMSGWPAEYAGDPHPMAAQRFAASSKPSRRHRTAVPKPKPAVRKFPALHTPHPLRNSRSAASRFLPGTGLLGLLSTGTPPEVSAVIADALGSEGAPAVALDRALAGAGGVASILDETQTAPLRRGGSGEVTQVGDLRSGSAMGAVEVLHPGLRLSTSGSAAAADAEFDSSDPSPAGFRIGHIEGIQACFEQGLERHPNLQGTLVTAFTVGTDQRVKDLEFDENSLGSDEVANCIRIAIYAWTPPFRPTKPVRLSYPMLFWAAM